MYDELFELILNILCIEAYNLSLQIHKSKFFTNSQRSILCLQKSYLSNFIVCLCNSSIIQKDLLWVVFISFIKHNRFSLSYHISSYIMGDKDNNICSEKYDKNKLS